MTLNLLWTDYCLFFMVFIVVLVMKRALKKQHIKTAFKQVFKRRIAIISFIVLVMFVTLGLLDSIHFNKTLTVNNKSHISVKLYSVLDTMLSPLNVTQEKTYSAPFALHAYSKETVIIGDKTAQVYPRLTYPPKRIKSDSQRNQRILMLISAVTLKLLAVIGLCVLLFILINKVWLKQSMLSSLQNFGANSPLKTLFLTLAVCAWIVWLCYALSREFHVLGTGKIGQDIFYYSVKSIRTGLIIGTLTTLFMLPLAVLLGISAGYFGGLVDDVIQYIYTTLSSIPGVLLIAASVLSIQIYIANHADDFPTLAIRADARLLALCLILGVTSWTGLCRLLRAESLKLREVDYVQAAVALGTKPFKIITRHLLPNVMHLVLIAVVLDFSFLVLAEAVLSYVGVGVSPMTISWGNMINGARLELARDPIVWWPMLSAFSLMFILVLAANLFADAIRDAFDPRNTL